MTEDMQNGAKKSMNILRERFCTFDFGSKVAMAVEFEDANRFAVRMETDGELLPGLDVPERYHDRLRTLMARSIEAKLNEVSR